jgi:hypothetical protein
VAGTQPNGLPIPTDSTSALVAALPTNGALASGEDIKVLADRMEELEIAAANANSADAEKTNALLRRILQNMSASTANILK